MPVLLCTDLDVVRGVRGQSADDWGPRQRGVVAERCWQCEGGRVAVQDVVLQNNAVSWDRGADVDHHRCGRGHQADDVHSRRH